MLYKQFYCCYYFSFVLLVCQGRIVALDKTVDKVSRITSNADKMGLTCIQAYAFDARKAMKEDAGN